MIGDMFVASHGYIFQFGEWLVCKICHPSLQCISVLLINSNINHTTGFALDTVWRSYVANINNTGFVNYCCSTYWDLKNHIILDTQVGFSFVIALVCMSVNCITVDCCNGLTPVRCVSIIWTKYNLFFIGHLGTGLSEIVKESLSTNWVENIVCRSGAMLFRPQNNVDILMSLAMPIYGWHIIHLSRN